MFVYPEYLLVISPIATKISDLQMLYRFTMIYPFEMVDFP